MQVYLEDYFSLAELRRGLPKRRYTNEEYINWAGYGTFKENTNWRPSLRQVHYWYNQYVRERRGGPHLSLKDFIKYWNNLENGTKWVYASVLHPLRPLPKDNLLQNSTIHNYWWNKWNRRMNEEERQRERDRMDNWAQANLEDLESDYED
jgi:hypothetical protein